MVSSLPVGSPSWTAPLKQSGHDILVLRLPIIELKKEDEEKSGAGGSGSERLNKAVFCASRFGRAYCIPGPECEYESGYHM